MELLVFCGIYKGDPYPFKSAHLEFVPSESEAFGFWLLSLRAHKGSTRGTRIHPPVRDSTKSSRHRP